MQVVAIFCVRYLRLFDYLSAAKLVLSEQRCQEGAAKMTPSWYCRNSAAKLAASWARLTKLAASMVIYAKLAVSMAVQAILGAFLAALVRHDHARKTFSLYFVVTLLWLLKLRINGFLQIRRQLFCFSCAFHMRQRIGTKLDVYGCFDSPLNAQIGEKTQLNMYFAFKNHQ